MADSWHPLLRETSTCILALANDVDTTMSSAGWPSVPEPVGAVPSPEGLNQLPINRKYLLFLVAISKIPWPTFGQSRTLLKMTFLAIRPVAVNKRARCNHCGGRRCVKWRVAKALARHRGSAPYGFDTELKANQGAILCEVIRISIISSKQKLEFCLKSIENCCYGTEVGTPR